MIRRSYAMLGLLIIAVILLLVALTAFGPAVGDAGDMAIRVWHDDERAVTCWVASGSGKGGIACLPDAQVGKR